MWRSIDGCEWRYWAQFARVSADSDRSPRGAHPMAYNRSPIPVNGLHFVGHQSECVGSAARPQRGGLDPMTGKKNPPLVFTTFPANAPVTLN